jgi:hypothetical protein
MAQRNVSQFVDLMLSPMAVAFEFKPRFLIGDDGNLVLVPVANFTFEQYVDCVKNPGKYLTHDYFLPGGPSGVRKPGFPYLLSVLRVRHHFRFQAERRHEPACAAFYRPDYPSKALQVTTGIIRAFFKDAQAMGKAPLLALFVEEGDIEHYQTTKRWVYQPLLEQLRLLGIPYVDVGQFYVEKVPAHDIPNLFLPNDGHPSAEGCRLQALAVYQHLVDRGLVKPNNNTSTRPTTEASASK